MRNNIMKISPILLLLCCSLSALAQTGGKEGNVGNEDINIVKDYQPVLNDAFKIMPRTPSHLEVQKCLINNVTIRELMKFGRDEMGGDYSQEVFKNGWSATEFMGAEWIVTIKRDLVPDDTLFMFADEKFIGKSLQSFNKASFRFLFIHPTAFFILYIF